MSLLKKTFSEYSEDKVARLAASTSFYIILSIAPVLFIATSVLRFFAGKREAEQWLYSELGSVVPTDVLDQIMAMLGDIQSTTGSWLSIILSFLILIISSTAVMDSLQYSLNSIWSVQRSRSGIAGAIHTKIIGIMLLILFGLLLVIVFVASAIFATFQSLLPESLSLITNIIPIAYLLFSVGILSVFFAVLFQYLPDVEIQWKDVFIGAFVTALLFALGQILIGIYFAYSNIGSATGIAGSLMAVLLWLFYSTQVFLFGAEYTKVYTQQVGTVAKPSKGATFIETNSIAIEQLSLFQKLFVVCKTLFVQVKIAKKALNAKSKSAEFFKKITRSKK